MWGVPDFKVEAGETEHVSFNGRRRRNPTVLIKVGRLSLSRQALLLGVALVVCQLLDGLLTWAGLTALGVELEGNTFLRHYMEQFGLGPVLLVAKGCAILLAVALMLHAHSRRWIRPWLLGVVCLYLCLAVLPWAWIVSHHALMLP